MWGNTQRPTADRDISITRSFNSTKPSSSNNPEWVRKPQPPRRELSEELLLLPSNLDSSLEDCCLLEPGSDSSDESLEILTPLPLPPKPLPPLPLTTASTTTTKTTIKTKERSGPTSSGTTITTTPKLILNTIDNQGDDDDKDVSLDDKATVTTEEEFCPDFSLYTTKKLKMEVAKYGFRPSNERSVLIEILSTVWKSLQTQQQQQRQQRQQREIKSPKKTVKEANIRQESNPPPLHNHNNSNKQKKIELLSGSDSTGDRLKTLLASNTFLYSKVLRYEPLSIDELVAAASSMGWEVGKANLIKRLDEQCITFYIQNPQDGRRQRH